MERAYKDWKGAMDDLWANKHHRLVEEQAARARQEEAARRTQLVNARGQRNQNRLGLIEVKYWGEL